MVEIKEKKDTRIVGILQEVEDWNKTKKGVSCRVKIDGSWYTVVAKTPIQLQNIMQPLELKKEVEFGWRKSLYKGNEYYFITIITPVQQRNLEGGAASTPLSLAIM